MAHTKGPFHVDRRAATRIVAGDDDTVATTGCQSSLRDDWADNAILFAAAPDMLAALREAEIAFKHLRFDGDKFPEMATAKKNVNAAIAKAEGR